MPFVQFVFSSVFLQIDQNVINCIEGVLLSDLKLAKQVFCSSAWLNRTLDSQNHYVHIVSFSKAIGILFGNGQHWKESRKIVVKLLREHNRLDQAHLEDLYATEIRPVLQVLYAKLEDQNGPVVFSPSHLFAVPVINCHHAHSSTLISIKYALFYSIMI